MLDSSFERIANAVKLHGKLFYTVLELHLDIWNATQVYSERSSASIIFFFSVLLNVL